MGWIYGKEQSKISLVLLSDLMGCAISWDLGKKKINEFNYVLGLPKRPFSFFHKIKDIFHFHQ